MQSPTKIIQCPNCEQVYRNKSVIYWLENEKKIWSDGYMENDIKQEFPLIMLCDECYDYFWIKGMGKSKHPGPGVKRLALNKVEVSGKYDFLNIRKLTPEEYAEAIAMKKYRNREEERYLRTNLWWAINAPFRSGGPDDISPERYPLFEENLETLIYKTPADSPENLLVLAEICRELGLFSKSEKYLNQLPVKSYKPVIIKMKEKIINKEKKVFQL